MTLKFLFAAADRYLDQSDWKDLALIKFCLFSIGLLAGVHIPEKSKKPCAIVSLIIFIGTYVPLMLKLFRIMGETSQEN